MEKKIEHKDILGNTITPESKLAVAHKNQLRVCSIMKMSPKMLRVKPLSSKPYNGDGYLVYPLQTVVVDGPDALAYMLKT